jgi:TPR repeat protein
MQLARTRIFQSLAWMLYMLCVAVIWPAYSQAATIDKGSTYIEALFEEQLNYIKHQGGPRTDPDDVLRQISSVFYNIDHPVCPHCLSWAPATDKEETAISDGFRVQAEAGKPTAQLQLAVRYLEGKGIARDSNQGLRWLQAAADAGVGEAISSLAQMYDSGIVVPVDQQKAAQLYERVANASPYSQFARLRLGEMNEFGIGIPRNYTKAMALYQSNIATDGHALPSLRRTAFAIGRMYVRGKGVARDDGKAAAWFLIAADKASGYQGLAEAKCALAIMYRGGFGIERSLDLSDFFLNRPDVLRLKACRDLKEDLYLQSIQGPGR